MPPQGLSLLAEVRGSRLFVRGERFPDARAGGSFALKEVSSCRWDPVQDALLLLGDEGVLYGADLRITDGALEDVVPRWALPLSRPGAGLDTEGLAFAGDDLLVSTEYHRLPLSTSLLDVAAFNRSTGEYFSSSVFIPPYVLSRVENNGGFEALVALGGGEVVVTANEAALSGDAADVRRVMAFQAATGALLAMAAYRVDSTADGRAFGLVEFARHPAVPTGLLALERTYRAGAGNDIRLHAVDLARPPADVTDCEELRSDGCSGCLLAPDDALEKAPIFSWSAGELTSAASGRSFPVAVDNYEAACLLPGGAGGEAWLLLVNDDNDSPHQIGTQFVLVALESNASASAEPSEIPVSAWSARARLQARGGGRWWQRWACGSGQGEARAAAVVVAAVLLVLGAVACCWCRRRLSAKQRLQRGVNMDSTGGVDLADMTPAAAGPSTGHQSASSGHES